uniref:SERPIN domain-containing protein n=1 Tax=Macrostomum lignano TaxID=282301 RepID=A0A1I8J8N9_9PLAT
MPAMQTASKLLLLPFLLASVPDSELLSSMRSLSSGTAAAISLT